jgi:energy-coupling factor transport system ATP-binding protein
MSLIKMEGASYHYPNGRQAVDRIDLAIEAGESVAIVGQNGAGKTTAAKLMNGLFRPSAGLVTVDGEDTRKRTTAQISRLVGYVFQNPDDQIFHNDVRSEIEFGPRTLGLKGDALRARAEEAAEISGVTAHMEENPYNLPLPIRKFVAIASTLAMGCRAFVLDEPTAGQDRAGMAQISMIGQAMTPAGAAIVTITHDMQFVVNTFDRVVVMADRRIIADGPKREVFWDFGVLDRAALRQPPLAELAGETGIGRGALDAADLVAAVATGSGGSGRG